ncbi:hypothetical protein [Janthinobacterium sp. B9-8]|uniref:hypothetical protein n=1 Tax=Janthinobacterium sp. B9-8 TaxID=1236179 RepID=UPI00061CE028|nr:hypothetical protein [Janthinobacterium sp. B9-8]AMC36623.1 hypothetical protein VN23_19515 [Janthinobacterium sp. B9-8]
MNLISTRKPTGKDIVDLLLLCAPKDCLDELEITKENHRDAAIDFDSLGTFHFAEMFALSLFYASKSAVNKKKSYPLIQSLQISPDALFLLAEVIRSEEFDEVRALYKEIQNNINAKGGLKKAKNSPVASAKKFVNSCWDDWIKQPSMFKSKAEFARCMIDKFPEILTSQKVIEDWCRQWGKKAKLQP